MRRDLEKEGGREEKNAGREEGKDSDEKEGMEGRRKGERGKGGGGKRERRGRRKKDQGIKFCMHDVHGIIFPFLICCTYTSFIQRTMYQKQLYTVDIHDLPRPVSLPRHLQGRNHITNARMVLCIFTCSIYTSQQAF